MNPPVMFGLSCALGVLAVVALARALRAAIGRGESIERRFTRVHSPLIASLFGISAAIGWISRGGAHDGAWTFVLRDVAIAASAALGFALVLGKNRRISGGAVVIFWATAILALFSAGGLRVTMLEGQAMFLAGLVVVWSGLPRLENAPVGPGRPIRGVGLAYILVIASGVLAQHAVAGGGAIETAAHGLLIALACVCAALPALTGAGDGTGATVWFASLSALLGVGLVPMANAMSIGIGGALEARGSGNPYWWVLLSEALSLNIYTGGAASALPDAYAMVVLSIVALFVCVAGAGQAKGVRGALWGLVGVALLGLALAFGAVRFGFA